MIEECQIVNTRVIKKYRLKDDPRIGKRERTYSIVYYMHRGHYVNRAKV